MNKFTSATATVATIVVGAGVGVVAANICSV